MIRRILIVEDAPQVAGILVSKLGREGHQVRWVRDGAHARQALAAEPADLVLLSTTLLPERNAWELLPELRALCPMVVMLLEAEESALRDKALGLGAADVILKPFKPTVVARQIRELPLPA